MEKLVVVLLCLLTLLSLFSCDIRNANENNDISVCTDSNASLGDTGTTPTQKTQAEIAAKQLMAAIHDEINVIDQDLGEIKLSNYIFPNNNLRLGDCNFLKKAVAF